MTCAEVSPASASKCRRHDFRHRERHPRQQPPCVTSTARLKPSTQDVREGLGHRLPLRPLLLTAQKPHSLGAMKALGSSLTISLLREIQDSPGMEKKNSRRIMESIRCRLSSLPCLFCTSFFSHISLTFGVNLDVLNIIFLPFSTSLAQGSEIFSCFHCVLSVTTSVRKDV